MTGLYSNIPFKGVLTTQSTFYNIAKLSRMVQNSAIVLGIASTELQMKSWILYMNFDDETICHYFILRCIANTILSLVKFLRVVPICVTNAAPRYKFV